METLSVSCMVGGAALLGAALGTPDIGWVGAAVIATVWIDRRLAKIGKKFDTLPCVRSRKRCVFGKNDENDEETT